MVLHPCAEVASAVARHETARSELHQAAFEQVRTSQQDAYMANLEQSTAPTVEVERVEVEKVRLS